MIYNKTLLPLLSLCLSIATAKSMDLSDEEAPPLHQSTPSSPLSSRSGSINDTDEEREFSSSLKEREVIDHEAFLQEYMGKFSPPILMVIMQNLYDTNEPSFYATRRACKKLYNASNQVLMNTGQIFGDYAWQKTVEYSKKLKSMMDGRWHEYWSVCLNPLNNPNFPSQPEFEQELLEKFIHNEEARKYIYVFCQEKQIQNLLQHRFLVRYLRETQKECTTCPGGAWRHGMVPLIFMAGTIALPIMLMNKEKITGHGITTHLKPRHEELSSYTNLWQSDDLPFATYFKLRPENILYVIAKHPTYNHPWAVINNTFSSFNLEPYVNASGVPLKYWQMANSNYSKFGEDHTSLTRTFKPPVVLPAIGLTFSIVGGVIGLLNCCPWNTPEYIQRHQTKDLNLLSPIDPNNPLHLELQDFMSMCTIRYPNALVIRGMMNKVLKGPITEPLQNSEEFKSFLNLVHLYGYSPTVRWSSGYQQLLDKALHTLKNQGWRHRTWTSINKDFVTMALNWGVLLAVDIAMTFWAKTYTIIKTLPIINWDKGHINTIPAHAPFFSNCSESGIVWLTSRSVWNTDPLDVDYVQQSPIACSLKNGPESVYAIKGQSVTQETWTYPSWRIYIYGLAGVQFVAALMKLFTIFLGL